MKEMNVVIVGLYTYFNVPVRILHPLADRLEGVKAHTIFYKNYDDFFQIKLPPALLNLSLRH